MLFWVATRRWFASDEAEALGFLCSEAELDEAERHPMNLIKTVHGVSLYLSMKIPVANAVQKS